MAAKSPPPRNDSDTRAETRRAVEAWLTDMWPIATGELALTERVTEDVVAEHPYGFGIPALVEGADAVEHLLRGVPKVFSSLRVHNLEFHDLLDPHRTVVEAEGSGTRRGDGAPYANRYVFFVTVRDGRVAAYREYANPAPVAAAVSRDAP